MKKVYFVGICGIGTSALAQYFKAQNWAVFGSDAVARPILAALRKARINVKIGHKKGNLPADTDLVVISQAVRGDNPELREARRRGIRILTYSEVVAELTEQYRTVAVAGAHGKSTTTALAALLLIRAGLDPTVIIGTTLREFGDRNFRNGWRGSHGGWFVVEADEFGNAFGRGLYSPALAIMTNIDREHLDVFKNLEGVKKAFVAFAEGVVSGGTLIVNRDDGNLRSLRAEIAAIERRRGVRVVWYSEQSAAARKVRRVLKIPGAHNVSNAAAVYELGRALRIPERKILAAIGSYRGAWRRMEYRGRFGGAKGGAPIYDDYAHHPTEIRATLRALRDKYPDKKILCVFQPHQLKRLEALFGDFLSAFDFADKTLVLPAYNVEGRDEKKARRRRDAQALVRAIQKKEPHKLLFYLADPQALKSAIRTLAVPPSRHVIVMMGAGDIADLTAALLVR